MFSPQCQHDLACPRVTDGSGTPCNFEQDFHHFNKKGLVSELTSERFCYLVLKKGPRVPGKYIFKNVLTLVRICKDGLHCIVRRPSTSYGYFFNLKNFNLRNDSCFLEGLVSVCEERCGCNRCLLSKTGLNQPSCEITRKVCCCFLSR